ncbi:MAG: hypothetical protein ACTSX2_00050 [Candidatus Thorarchaeota archaeon]
MATPPDDMSVQQAIVWLAKNGVKIEVSDVEIGAVEIKDATSDTRATVDTDGRLFVKTIRNGTQSLDEGDMALTTSWKQPSIAGHEHLLIQNREPIDGSGGWIEFSFLSTGKGPIRLYPGETVCLDGVIAQNGQLSLKGESGGEAYSLLLWG